MMQYKLINNSTLIVDKGLPQQTSENIYIKSRASLRTIFKTWPLDLAVHIFNGGLHWGGHARKDKKKTLNLLSLEDKNYCRAIHCVWTVENITEK